MELTRSRVSVGVGVALACGLVAILLLKSLHFGGGPEPKAGAAGDGQSSPVLEHDPAKSTPSVPLDPGATPSGRVDVDEPTSAEPESETVSVTGRFVDTAGLPVSGVRVVIEETSASPILSDATGRFRIKSEPESGGVFDRAQFLLALHPSYQQFEKQLRIGQSRALDLGTIRLSPGGSLHGKVHTSTGAPADDADVFVLESQTSVVAKVPASERALSVPRSPTREVKTDRDGGYEVLGLEAGAWQVWAQGSTTYCEPGPTVDVREGENVSCDDLLLVDLPRTFLIKGMVVGPDGQPVEGARVAYKSVSGSGSGITDTLPGARFCIRVASEGQAYLLEPGAGADATNLVGDQQRAVGGDNGVVLHLHTCATVSVRVVDPRGSPVQEFGWRLESDSGAGKRVLAADPPRPRTDGRAEFCQREGATRLCIDAKGYSEGRFPCGEKYAGLSTTPIVLQPLPFVAGLVCLGNGTPVARALVQLARPEVQGASTGLPPWGGKGIGSTRTDANGRFRVYAAAGGRMRLGVSGTDIAPYAMEGLQVPESGGLEDLRIALPGAARVYGRLLVPAGVRPDGLEVEILRGGKRDATCTVDEKGEFRSGELAPGNLGIRVASIPWDPTPGEPGSITLLVVHASEERRIDLDVRPGAGAEVRGRLSFGGRSLAEGVVVNCWRDESRVDPRWSLDVRSPESPEAILTGAPVRADGTFALRFGTGGTYRVRLHGSAGYTAQMSVEKSLTVPSAGRVQWDVELLTGCVLVHGPAMSTDELKDFFIVCHDVPDGGAQVVVQGSFGSDHTMVFPLVPAGRAELYRGARTETQVLARVIEVSASSVVQVEVP